ncbi:MAG: hypothetical protein ACJ8F1_14190, partial [Polyangia bacterium]
MARGFGQRWHLEDRFGDSLVVTGWGAASPEERATALDPHTARWTLEHGWRGWWRDEGRNDLAEIYGLLSYDTFNLRNVTTQELARRVFDAVERGHLVVFRAYSNASAHARPDAVSVLVRQVTADRRDVSFDGRTYRIVDLALGVPNADRRDWRLVDRAEAVDTIEQMLDRVPRTTEERSHWSALLNSL